MNRYRCGASLADISLPFTRLEECPACENYLHVCRMCVYFDPAVPKQCREDDAEEVQEKERANFCTRKRNSGPESNRNKRRMTTVVRRISYLNRALNKAPVNRSEMSMRLMFELVGPLNDVGLNRECIVHR